MKQGHASSQTPDYKTEPKANAVSPGAVSRLGIHPSPAEPKALYKGRGLEAPMVGTTIHHCGSQGTHK